MAVWPRLAKFYGVLINTIKMYCFICQINKLVLIFKVFDGNVLRFFIPKIITYDLDRYRLWDSEYKLKVLVQLTVICIKVNITMFDVFMHLRCINSK